MSFGEIAHTLLNVHPWHATAVHFPIALTGAALLFTVLALWRRSEWLEHAAYYSITHAAVTTVLAGFTGLRDNIVRFEGGAPLVSAKMFLAVSLFALTTVMAAVRRKRRNLLWEPSTVVLYVAAFAGSFCLAAVLGYLGGVILYGA